MKGVNDEFVASLAPSVSGIPAINLSSRKGNNFNLILRRQAIDQIAKIDYFLTINISLRVNMRYLIGGL